MLTNYVTNAIKYAEKGYIKIGYQICDNDYIRSFVIDTGIGIAEDKKGKLFGRFEKIDDFAQGTGLCLAISKAIAEHNGGSMGFNSVKDKGSEFWFCIKRDMRK